MYALTRKSDRSLKINKVAPSRASPWWIARQRFCCAQKQTMLREIAITPPEWGNYVAENAFRDNRVPPERQSA
jgi:hypothetical protein